MAVRQLSHKANDRRTREKTMSQIAKDVQSTGRRMTAFGIITIIIGIASIAAPLVTGVSIVVSVGIFVIAAGILRMMWAFSAGSFGSGLLAFAIGGLTLLCGLSLVSEPIFAFGFLTVLIVIYLFADGWPRSPEHSGWLPNRAGCG